MSRYLIVGVLLSGFMLGGCGMDKVLPDKQQEYKKSRSLPDLEVPPDLSSESINDTMAVPEVDAKGTATFSTYQQRIAVRGKTGAGDPGGAAGGSRVSSEKVLIVNSSLAELWPRLRSFWTERGYVVRSDDQEHGVLETDWYENRVDLTRDMFKVTITPGKQEGTLALHLAHSGEEMKPQGERLIWQKRARDGALEERIATSLKYYLDKGSVKVQSRQDARLLHADEDAGT
jgi:outer membrane protein assembly factor BamC